MKYIKNSLYLLGVLLSIGVLLMVSGEAAQRAIEFISRKIGAAVSSRWLFSVSGNLAVAMTGSAAAFYVQKKHCTDWIKVKKIFRFKTGVYYWAIAESILCILGAVTTFVCANIFSMTEEINRITEKSRIEFLLMDLFFPLFAAPIFEELLFRMGLYSLLRRRLGQNSGVLLCSIIFAANHGYSLEGFISCLTAGLIFMLIYIHTGNLWYSIAAHSMSNLSICIMNVLEDRGVKLMGIPIQYEISGFNMVHPLLLFLAVAFCGICILKKLKALEKTNADQKNVLQ